MAGLPLYILMLGAAGKYIVGMLEYMNDKSQAVKRFCTHPYTELIIAYLNITVVMGLFLFGYSYFGYDASRGMKLFPNATDVISLPGYGYNYTFNRINDYGSNWTKTESVYYSMISLTTIGFGDYYLGNPETPKQAAMLFLSISFGFALFSYAFQTYAKLSEKTVLYLKNKTGKLTAAAAIAAQGELMNMVDKMPGLFESYFHIFINKPFRLSGSDSSSYTALSLTPKAKENIKIFFLIFKFNNPNTDWHHFPTAEEKLPERELFRKGVTFLKKQQSDTGVSGNKRTKGESGRFFPVHGSRNKWGAITIWVFGGLFTHARCQKSLKSDFLKLSPPWMPCEFLFARRNLVLALTPLFLGQFGQIKVLRTPKIMLFPVKELANKTVVLLEIQEDIMDRYPELEDEKKMENVTKALELLCYIQTYPRHRWSFWAAFDFCVSIITTVGYGSLHPTTWYSKALTLLYSMAGLPLYILMLGAAGKYIVGMLEYMNDKSQAVKRFCTHPYTELIIAYLNITVVMGLFLFSYSCKYNVHE
eukprot:sb/3463764/